MPIYNVVFICEEKEYDAVISGSYPQERIEPGKESEQILLDTVGTAIALRKKELGLSQSKHKVVAASYSHDETTWIPINLHNF